jgi:hypothetical protein
VTGAGGLAGTNGTAGGPSGGAGGALVCAAGLGDCDGNRDNGCETSFATSDANCGACGHDCTAGGATCSSGLCTSADLYENGDLPFGTDNGAARSWAFDGASANVVWVGFNSYAVRRYPLDGSGAKIVWQPTAATTAGTESLAISGANAYWSIGGTPAAVLQKPVLADPATAPTVAFNPAARAMFLRIRDGYFYWATGDYQDPSTPAAGLIYRRALAAPASDAGTAIVTVDQGNWADIKGLEVTSDAVYWVSDKGQGTANELRVVPLAGGTPNAVPMVAGASDTAIVSSQGTPALYPSGATLLFARAVSASPMNGIYRYEMGAASPSLLVSADGVTSLLADGQNIFFVRANDNHVYKAPLTGGPAVAMAFASGQKLLAQDTSYLYLLQSGCCASKILKVLK